MNKLSFVIPTLILVALLGCTQQPQGQPIVPKPQPTEVIPPPQPSTEIPVTATVSPESPSKIAFVRNYSDYYGWDIFTANSDGTGISRITSDASKDSRPVLSPDGTQIAFESIREWHGLPSIYTMDIDGHNIKCLTPEVEFCKSPSWSPDKRISYCVFKNIGVGSSPRGASLAYAPDSILVMDSNGNNKHHIVKGWSPSWLPDGQHIAFLANRSGIWIVCITNIDGLDAKEYPTCISPPSSCGIRYQTEKYPALSVSPVGNSVAFDSRDFTGKRDIYTMSLNNGEITKLTGNIPSSCYEPTWSPDGSKIAFTIETNSNNRDSVGNIGKTSGDSTGNVETDIYVMDSDGNNPTLLIKDGMFPSWQKGE